MEVSGVDSKALLSRSESTYMDVEQCASSYELRHIVAYEAAIRNEDIKAYLYSYLSEADDRSYIKLKSVYGFTDEAIFYYRITHKDLFPITSSSTTAHGLSSIDKSNDSTHSSMYDITPLCSEADVVVVNDTPLYRENGSIGIADMAHYGDFEKLQLEYKMARPKLSPIKARKFFVELNFDLPVTELTEYIELLYALNQKHSILSVLELLDDALDLSVEKQKKLASKRYADILYVYDCYTLYGDKYGIEIDLHKKIASDLAYSMEDRDERILSTNTIKNYISDMNALVNDYAYLKLLTAIEQ